MNQTAGLGNNMLWSTKSNMMNMTQPSFSGHMLGADHGIAGVGIAHHTTSTAKKLGGAGGSIPNS